MASEPDPVAEALRVAVETSGFADAGIGGDGDPYDAQVLAAAIVAFLRQIARTIPADQPRMVAPVLYLEDLAWAVQARAAREGRDGG